MWIRRGALELAAAAVLWLVLQLAALPALAQAPPQPQLPEEVILTVVANGVNRGEFTLLHAGADYWALPADLKRLGVLPDAAARRELAGEAYYSLAALAVGGMKYSEAELTLTLNFGLESMQGTRIDLANPPAPLTLIEPQTSLIAGYRAFARHSGGGGGSQAGVQMDLNLRFRSVLVHQDLRVQGGNVTRTLVRGPSQVMWDDFDRGARLTLGDVLSSAGAYGSTVIGGGVLYARQFELTPDLIRQPAATVQATTSLPADVEVSVDGNVITRARVGPGPITVQNLLQYGGTRQVRVTVTDVSGHRQVFDQPFFFTDQVLARGVHDFSYFIGRRADLDAEGEARYRELAFQAFHRYGLTDSLTVSAGGEGTRDFTNAGAGFAVRSDRFGLAALDMLSSFDRVRHTRGMGWQARYAYIRPNWAVQLSRRQFADTFRSFAVTGSAFPRHETRASVSGRVFNSTLSLDLSRSDTATERRSTATFRLTTSLSRRWSLSAELQTGRVNGVTQRLANVFLRFEFDANHWASASVYRSDHSTQAEVETGKLLTQGEGLGYRVGTTTTTGDGASTTSAYGSATWNLRPATVEVFGNAPLRGDAGSYSEAAVSGAFVAVGGYYGITRRIDDSFVVAKLGVPQPDVDVLVNNQVQGRTDSQGKLFLPEVGSNSRQEISVNDKQVGIEYNLREKTRTVTLPYRSGAVVDFGARRVHSLTGMVHLVDGGKRHPPPPSTLTLQGPGGRSEVETSSAGDFYMEDAPAGDYTGRLEVQGKAYACHMRVPEFSEPVHELQEGLVCE